MLGGLFGKATFLGEDLEPWCLETWAWLMRNLGGMERLRELILVTPTRDYFPPTEAVGDERGAHVFEHVKLAMGLAEWPCVLELYHRREANARVDELLVLQGRGAPNGTFHWSEDGAVVRYARDLIDHPSQLVATMAHELCHYLLATIAEPSPGGAETHELDTDLTVAYLGLGIFGGNGAFEFKQYRDTYSQGWSSRRSGYISERTWAFALALFLRLRDQPGAAQPWLKPGLAAEVAKADRYLVKHDELLAPLRAL
jgi:hypothetical protein